MSIRVKNNIHWAGKIDGWEETLVTAARDGSALVRAEAAKAAVEFKGVADLNASPAGRR